MIRATWLHTRSFAYVSEGSVNVRGCISLPLLYMLLTVCIVPRWSWPMYSVSTSCSLQNYQSWLQVTTNRVWYRHAFLWSLDSASGAWCLIPAHWTTSTSSSSCHLAKVPEASADVSNCFKATWLVRMIKKLKSVMFTLTRSPVPQPCIVCVKFPASALHWWAYVFIIQLTRRYRPPNLP